MSYNIPIRFMNDTHKESFYNAIAEHDISLADTERTSLFYVLTLMDETRKRLSLFYDDADGCIRVEVLDKPFQTSGTLAMTRLAFSLYNDFSDDTHKTASVLDIFCSVDREYVPYLFEAIKLRLNMVKPMP